VLDVLRVINEQKILGGQKKQQTQSQKNDLYVEKLKERDDFDI